MRQKIFSHPRGEVARFSDKRGVVVRRPGSGVGSLETGVGTHWGVSWVARGSPGELTVGGIPRWGVKP